jgi:16S rRNA (cytosine967-C5)-methyltransferase
VIVLNKKKGIEQNKKREITVSPARLAAFEVLTKIEREKAFSSILLTIYEEKLKPEDRALCHELTLGVLRHQLYLDKIIEHFTTKKIDLEVLFALRLGLYQLRFLSKIPPHAAINESVNLVHLAKLRSAAGFVNAILRNSLRENLNPLEKITNPLERLSVEYSHPLWLVKKWEGNFGQEVENLLKANNQPPKPAFRLTNKGDENVINDLKDTGLEFEESKIVENCWITQNSNTRLRELANQGLIYFQDEASQIVASIVNIKPDENYLDVCASPGSKFTLVARNAKTHPGLRIAGDFFTARVNNLRENCRRQGVGNIEIVQYDAEKPLPFAENSFDKVLVDAPCSGTGTLRHNPEIRWHLKETDFAGLAEKQLKILSKAAKMVKTGGSLIYSTCSLEPEENENVVEEFLRQNNEFRSINVKLPDRFLSVKGFARTFPHRDQTDGFFITVFFKS